VAANDSSPPENIVPETPGTGFCFAALAECGRFHSQFTAPNSCAKFLRQIPAPNPGG
jgi:hypothetical protein